MSKTTDPELLTAKFISFVSNPVFVLLFSFILGNLQVVRNSPEITAMFFFLGGFLPFLLYLHYLWIHKNNLLDYASIPRDKRNNLFLAATISFALNVMIFIYTGTATFWIYSSMLFVILFATFYLLNKFIDKASFHTAIFAFGVLYLTNKVSVAFAILLILVPFIAWSRIYLHKHSYFQLMLGTVIGMFLAILSWTF